MSPPLPAGFELHTFAALDVRTLYELLALRQRVFIVEQRCLFLDADGQDERALHLLHRDGAGVIDAYARLFLPSREMPHARFGRVVTAPEVRGQRLGHRLVDVALLVLDALASGHEVHISAQAHLDAWYSKHGFVAVGDLYLEDDIPHLHMVRSQDPNASSSG